MQNKDKMHLKSVFIDLIWFKHYLPFKLNNDAKAENKMEYFSHKVNFKN